jgi:hypothetical protein
MASFGVKFILKYFRRKNGENIDAFASDCSFYAEGANFFSHKIGENRPNMLILTLIPGIVN